MRMLVIGSCTGDKDIRDCPDVLTQSDFDDLSLLQRREAELANWALPAAKLYTGWQHRYMMKGVDAIRHRFGASSCSVKIISAGYGLVDEETNLIPYEVTFQGKRPKWIHEHSQTLGIPTAVRKAVVGYDVVLFLLGKEYLLSINPSIAPAVNQKFVFFTSNNGLKFHPGSTIVPAGGKETRFGAGYVALKGKMFERFALALCDTPEIWNELLSENLQATVLALIEKSLAKTAIPGNLLEG